MVRRERALREKNCVTAVHTIHKMIKAKPSALVGGYPMLYN